MTAIEGHIPPRIAAELRYIAIIRDQRIRMHDWQKAKEAMDLYNLVFCRWYEANHEAIRANSETPN